MAAEDTHELDIAHQAMEDLAECLAIHGRVMAAVPPDRRLVTLEVVMRPAAEVAAVEATRAVEAAAVEATRAVEAEVTLAVVDMADITRLRPLS